MRRIVSFLGATLVMAGAKERPNVLLICIDDLRPELGCYGVDYIQSPNIDGLAQRGVTFENHYVQAPTCGASRYALLTGQLHSPREFGSFFSERTGLRKEKLKPVCQPTFERRAIPRYRWGRCPIIPEGEGAKTGTTTPS